MAGVFQVTIVDEAGNIQAGASVEFRHESSGVLASVFSDFELTSSVGNPVLAGSDGFVRVYLNSGLYRIVASLGEFSREWRHVAIGLTIDQETQDDIDGIGNELDEHAQEIADNVADIDRAGRVALENLMRLQAIGRPVNGTDFLSFELATRTLHLPTGVSLQEYFDTIETDALLLGQTVSLLGARNEAGTAFVLDTSTVKIDSDSGDTLAARFTALGAADGNNAAAVVTEQTARVAADGALASDITALSADLFDAEGDITANASAISSLTTTVSSQGSSISSLSSSVSSLSSTVSGHTSSISTLSSTSATLTGDVADLSARYGVSLNVDGLITGFVQNNDGDSGSFDILATTFRIAHPANGLSSPTTVFSVTGGVISAANMAISGSLLVNGTVTAGKLSVSTLAAITADIGALNINSTGRLAVGKSSASDTTAGIWLGTDGASGFDFHIGDAADYLWWDQSVGRLKLSPRALLFALQGPFITSATVTIGNDGSNYGYILGAGAFGSISPSSYIDGFLTIKTLYGVHWTINASTGAVAIRAVGNSLPNSDRQFKSLKIGAVTLTRSAATYTAIDGFGNTMWSWGSLNTSAFPTSSTVNIEVSCDGLA